VEAQEVAASSRVFYRPVGGVDAVIPMNTCHDLIISEPRRLAEILVERCRVRAR
jgi:hypothetical protein